MTGAGTGTGTGTSTGRLARGVVLGSTLVAAGCESCNTVDRDPVDECLEDSDCGTGSVCSLAQGNICVPEELPPRAVIGFDIEDAELRLELRGCDPEVTRELGGSELQVQKRSALVDEFNLTPISRRSVVNCGGDECEGVCDEQALTCSSPTDAEFTLTMASRLGRSALFDNQAYVAPLEGETSIPVGFIWPSYEVEPAVDPRAHAARVLDTRPSATNLSPFRRVLADDAQTEADELDQLDVVGVLRCQRGLFQTENGVRTFTNNTPVIGAAIEFRHAEAIAAPSTVIGTPPGCTEDDDCPQGWACNEFGSCGLDLTDVLAGSTASTADLLGGYPSAWVYTYCEETLAPMEPIVREFTVTVTPPAETGLPTVLYALEQEFPDPPTENSVLRQVEVEKLFCMPDWSPPQPVGFSVVGKPVTLAETELGTYTCCATDCLPSSEAGVEPIPPPNVDSCSGFTRARFETRWFNLVGDGDWEFKQCVPTGSYPDGANGRFRTDVTTCDGDCSVGLTPGAIDELTRTYSVTLTQPVGSVFQSQRTTVQITADTVEIPPIELTPRVLLRGQILCSTADNCVATNAVISAERLRVDSDDDDLPGPFFFEARVNATGDFVLPLDPGVYVITALPAVGQPGGPSRFAVVDLRDDSSLVELVDGVPNATLDSPLELDDGVLVRVALDGFAVSTGVTPIDVGSWAAQDDFPPYDLNDPMTCYATEAARGCTIRRLRPTDAPLSLLSSKLVQFTARNRGSSSCE